MVVAGCVLLATKVRIIDFSAVKELLTMSDTLEIVEKAFREKALNRVQMPVKPYLFLEKHGGDLRVMPSYLERLDECGVKIVNVHPDNPEKYNLPSVMATILLYQAETGALLAIMDGTWITAMRTGAAAGIATKYLARKNARRVGIVGLGYQSLFQLDALHNVVNIEYVKAYDIRKGRVEEFARATGRCLGIRVETADSIENAVRNVDILVTLTPVRAPIIRSEWIAEGTHINAIGADAPGKEELEPNILLRSKIVVDDWEQASHSGEINVPYSKGIIGKNDIYGEMGEIVAGLKLGRVTNDETTIFDSTGLSIHDVATGWHVYVLAKKKGIGYDIHSFFLPNDLKSSSNT